MPVFLSPLFLPFGHLYLALYLGAYLNGIDSPKKARSVKRNAPMLLRLSRSLLGGFGVEDGCELHHGVGNARAGTLGHVRVYSVDGAVLDGA